MDLILPGRSLTFPSDLMTMELNPITISPETGATPQAQLILLHGWGANAKDLTPLAPSLHLPDYQFIFPEAPFPHPQIPWGRAWYDLNSAEQRGLPESREALKSWLQSIPSETGLPFEQTILGGFSQGGAMTLDVGRDFPLAGLVVLSGYLHFQPQPQTAAIAPLMIVHGRQDPVVPLKAAQQARDQFQQLGAQVSYHEFDMAHEIRPEVIQLIHDFAIKVMPKLS